MFAFANALLLALFAAAALDLLLALRAAAPGGGRLRRAVTWLWNEEHFLFGSWGGVARAEVGGRLFALGLAAYEVSVVFCNSMARTRWPWVQGALAPALDWLAFLCLGGKILFGTRYTWRTMGMAGCLYFIARWVYFNSQNIWWIGIVVAVMAAKDAPLARALRAYLYSGLAAMAVVVGLYFSGLIAADVVSERLGTLRGTYGYGHPNTFGGLVFGLALAYALLHRRPRLRDSVVIAAAAVFLLLGPASRTAALCLLLLAALLALGCRRPALFAGRAASVLGPALVMLVGAMSFLLPLPLIKIGPWNDEFAPAALAALNRLLTGRLGMTWFAYRLYEVRIAGQVLDDWPPLDNSFAFTLYQFGPVVLVLLTLLLAAALWGYARRGLAVPFVCLLALLAYAFMECQTFHLTTDPAALLLCGAMYALPPARWPDPGAAS